MYSSSGSSYQYSSFYTTPYLYSTSHGPTTYGEQFKQLLGQRLAPWLPWALAPLGLYGAYRLASWLVPGPQHQPRLQLQDRSVLIVGASSGLGRQMAFEFYAKGAKLILAARSLDKLEQLCRELEEWGRARGLQNAHKPAYRYLDVAELNGGDDGRAQIRELASYALDGRTIDVLVCCAGLSSRGSALQTPLAVQRRLMEVNFFGFVAICRALLDCIPDDGAIVHINSIQGRVALPYRSPYSCSKHAIQAFFDSLRGEERANLQILVVNAGYINTGFGSRALDPQGKPMGFEDVNQQRGLSVEYAARRVVAALELRQTELLLAPVHIRLVVMLRWLAPNLLWWLLRRKALADKRWEEEQQAELKKKQQQQQEKQEQQQQQAKSATASRKSQ